MSYFQLLQRCVEFYFYLFTGAVLYLIQQKRRPMFVLRVILSAVGCVLVMNNFYYLFIKAFHGINALGNGVIYMSALLLLWPVLHFWFDISWSESCFCAAAGYCTQFIQSISSEMIYRTFNIVGNGQVLVQLACGVAVYNAAYVVFGRKMKKGQNFNVEKKQLLFLVVSVIIVQIEICFQLRQQWIYGIETRHMIADCLLLIICSSSVLILQFSMLTRHTLTDEIKILKQMRRKEQEQYRISSESIDLINRKCHDMRFQIRSIGQSANITPEALHDMEKTIGIYDAIYQTGCRPLDTILSEKSLYCQAHDMQINCVADAADLFFISEVDIYSLFGNILDNAINAVSKLDKEMRIIDLTIRRHGDMISVNAQNYYAGTVDIQDGLPLTQSSNKEYHGFGVKSIVAIAHKYNGVISFQAKDALFNLNILFPLDGQE